MTPEFRSEVVAALTRVSTVMADIPSHRISRRPIIGGSFGVGAFVLVSLPERLNGMDDVSYFVLHSESGFVIGAGYHDKAEALSSARAVLQKMELPALQKAISDFVEARRIAVAEAQRLRAAEFVEKQKKEIQSATEKKIPRRRRRIFEECKGQCHYCGTALRLEGLWHIDHKMPKALGGDNSPGNLVASCAPCNHAKRDTTDVEFFARREHA